MLMLAQVSIVSICDLAKIIAKVVGYEGAISFDASKPDGAPRKLTDVSRLRSLGWEYKISLYEGLTSTYKWFLDNQTALRK